MFTPFTREVPIVGIGPHGLGAVRAVPVTVAAAPVGAPVVTPVIPMPQWVPYPYAYPEYVAPAPPPPAPDKYTLSTPTLFIGALAVLGIAAVAVLS